MQKKSFAVIGAGLGGLAVALRLAHRGHSVTVFEKTDQVGGRLRERKVGTCTFDCGPTLLMMLAPFERLFADVGESLSTHLQLQKCDPNNRVWFGDGTKIEATSDMAKMIRELKQFGDAKAATKFPEMIGDLGRLYHEAVPRFVERNYNSILDLAAPASAYSAIKNGMLGNLWNLIGNYVSDERLQALFCIQSMYLGLSPWEAPSVYGVLTYMEYGEGIWYPAGGMVQIGKKVAELAEKNGATIHLNSEVSQITGKSVSVNGVVHQFDAVICNADLPYAEKKLLPKSRDVKRTYSCSTFMIYADYHGELPDLAHHNIVIGKDLLGNLNQIFRDNRIPDDPAFYCAISRRSDPEKAPPGHENLYILVPCPNLHHPWSEEDATTLTEKVFARLTQQFGLDAGKIAAMETFSPRDWASVLNLDSGATFGLSHHFNQSVCFRPNNKSKEYPGLYYVGASTVPGNGLPMVLIGAELVEKRLIEDGLLSP